MKILIMFKGGVETQEYFSVEMARTFESTGFKVYWYDMMLQQESAKLLKDFYKMHLNDEFAAFTFNFNGIAGESGLYDDETGISFWDDAGIHVYNMVVDHPLYYHRYMKFVPQKYTQICIDKNHVKYMKKYYKDIKFYGENGFLPLGGTDLNESAHIFDNMDYEPMNRRRFDVVFTGNYTPQRYLDKSLENVGKDYRDFYYSVIEEVISNPDSLIEDITERKIIQQVKSDASDDEIREFMPQMMYVDLSVRFYFRAKVIKTLVDNGIKVNICGAGWDMLKCEHPENIISIGNVDSRKCLEMISQSKLSLNVMPWFKDGAHDRVFNSMLNGAVCVTDTSKYLKSNFTDNKNIVFYNLRDIERLVPVVKNLLKDDEKLQNIADSAFHLCKKEHTWGNRAVRIGSLINEDFINKD